MPAMDSMYVCGTSYPLDAGSALQEAENSPRFVFLETSRVTGEDDTSYLFMDPVGEIVALSPPDLPRVFRQIRRALKDGFYLAGWIAYEFGYLLEPKLLPLLGKKAPGGPLLWFGVFKGPSHVWRHGSASGDGYLGVVPDVINHMGRVTPDTSREEYLDAVRAIKDYIADGHTYQVNYTIRERFGFSGRPLDLYLALRPKQAVSFGAVVRNDDRWIISLSPELFFRRRNGLIWSRPMKGTAARGRTVEEDRGMGAWLKNDVKNRAENVMIVDLLRNDLGRICQPGSVRVRDMFMIERYETLFQMTSTVTGRYLPGTGVEECLRALFPCGSVTGAPKIRTMEIIGELESSPRGIYTGSIGFIAPTGDMVFNVAIRTIDLRGTSGELGIGGGITIGSDPETEYEEAILKAKFLTEPFEEFKLIETMRWDRKAGYYLLDRHLSRLSRSAHYFGFRLDLHQVKRELEALEPFLGKAGEKSRVRLLLARDGGTEISYEAMGKEIEQPARVCISDVRTDAGDPFLFHKTTRREFYDSQYKRALQRGCVDVLFLNTEGMLTEGAISNLFVETGRGLATPPLEAGLLNGTLRQELLETGRAYEAALTLSDLENAGRFYIGNSVRGLIRGQVFA